MPGFSVKRFVCAFCIAAVVAILALLVDGGFVRSVVSFCSVVGVLTIFYWGLLELIRRP